jgi:hypothetical protein
MVFKSPAELLVEQCLPVNRLLIPPGVIKLK